VTTRDGYILTLHRIPFGARDRTTGDRTIKRPVMFLQHGVLGSSAQWVTNLPGQAAGNTSVCYMSTVCMHEHTRARSLSRLFNDHTHIDI
jgi:hypothetical protein